jgi:hypothetical protein
MRNITGTPVEGQDFFGREEEVLQFLELLEENANILLTAPRRVGKTSFVLEVCRRWEEEGKKATLLDVEDCADELAFAERLLGSLEKSGVGRGLLDSIGLSLRKIRKALGRIKLGAAGVNADLGDETTETVASVVEGLLSKVEQGDQKLLIAIDELPEMLLHLARNEEGKQRVSLFLHFLRRLRQSFRNQVRWIFLGSIGLDHFVEEHGLAKTINDLCVETLGVFPGEEALGFLERLGEAYGMHWEDEADAFLIDKLAWPLPHHLQLVFHTVRSRLRAGGAGAISKEDVDAAFEELLQPQRLSAFDTWRVRLDEELGPEDAQLAKLLLTTICQEARGAKRDTLLQAAMRAAPHADPQLTGTRIREILHLLVRDGYLIPAEGRWAFRSFLLREYWKRRQGS